MAGEPLGRQGTGVLEGMQRIRNAGKIIPMVKSCYCMWGTGQPSCYGLCFTDQEAKAERGQELARRHTANQKAAGSGSQACLEGAHSWAWTSRQRTPGAAWRVRLGKKRLWLESKGRPGLQRTDCRVPQLQAAGGGGAGWGSVWPSRFSSLSGHCQEAQALLPLGCCGFWGRFFS